ncbi:VIT1/CCC1 transporter family protein [Thermotoga sp. KOL6]|uniref:VIT1/CCC1 transporter family protein n=1 Tax=Thermotoga sp. KOL6 TaxID=126741 RepID=UPI000C790EA0|nr:VIT1/CCC1 transporter family protein [Thermotoga sp. KOL6]PLV59514.1 rubrerythrin family protein [Thermotoga sp. KOL6]
MKEILEFQKNEITEYHVYRRLSKRVKNENVKILLSIAEDERKHYETLKDISGKEIKPSKFLIFWYSLLAILFGITFALKLMEKNEKKAEKAYKNIAKNYPEVVKIMRDEEKHEEELLNMLDEERLNYVSSMVLGLNDALVELTGALAGLTYAFQNSKIVGLSGLITGIAAAFSMSASEYLSQRAEEENGKTNPLKAALYTGLAYIVTVTILVAPFLILNNPFLALAITLIGAALIVLLFTFFVSIVKEKNFGKYFLEMFLLSFGVAAFSFFVGIIARKIFGIEI